MADNYYRSSLTGQQLDEAFAKLGQVDGAVQQAEAAAALARQYAQSIDPSRFATAAQGQKADTAVQPSDLLDLVYPVGAVYISASAANPKALFGGTWTRIQGRFLLAADAGHPAGSTGGAEEVTLTEEQLPEISGSINAGSGSQETGYGAFRGADGVFTLRSSMANGQPRESVPYSGTAPGYAYADLSIGGGEAHNNMPPYLAVYVWQRTA